MTLMKERCSGCRASPTPAGAPGVVPFAPGRCDSGTETSGAWSACCIDRNLRDRRPAINQPPAPLPTGRQALVATRPMTRVGRAVEKSETQGFMKVLVDAETERILGAAILGVGGDEIIHSILDVM